MLIVGFQLHLYFMYWFQNIIRNIAGSIVLVGHRDEADSFCVVM